VSASRVRVASGAPKPLVAQCRLAFVVVCVRGSGHSDAKGAALGSRVVEGRGGAHGDGVYERGRRVVLTGGGEAARMAVQWRARAVMSRRRAGDSQCRCSRSGWCSLLRWPRASRRVQRSTPPSGSLLLPPLSSFLLPLGVGVCWKSHPW
jgi:hypothetical protein